MNRRNESQPAKPKNLLQKFRFVDVSLRSVNAERGNKESSPLYSSPSFFEIIARAKYGLQIDDVVFASESQLVKHEKYIVLHIEDDGTIQLLKVGHTAKRWTKIFVRIDSVSAIIGTGFDWKKAEALERKVDYLHS